MTGPTLRFNVPTTICLTGADMRAKLDGQPVPYWQPVEGEAGQTLAIGAVDGPGARTYLTVARRIRCAAVSRQSRSTFTLGKFGGHAGRALRAGDVLKLRYPDAPEVEGLSLPLELEPHLTHEWEIGVLYGPHGAPDFFTREDIATFFATEWKVHYNSARTGVRLIGPKPQWARTRRRRGRAAPIEHPRQRLRRRRDRFHRRHADHPRARWTEPRRIRLPGGDRAGGALESWTAQARRHRALSAVERRGRRGLATAPGCRDRTARSAAPRRAQNPSPFPPMPRSVATRRATVCRR